MLVCGKREGGEGLMEGGREGRNVGKCGGGGLEGTNSGFLNNKI